MGREFCNFCSAKACSSCEEQGLPEAAAWSTWSLWKPTSSVAICGSQLQEAGTNWEEGRSADEEILVPARVFLSPSVLWLLSKAPVLCPHLHPPLCIRWGLLCTICPHLWSCPLWESNEASSHIRKQLPLAVVSCLKLDFALFSLLESHCSFLSLALLRDCSVAWKYWHFIFYFKKSWGNIMEGLFFLRLFFSER